MSVMSEDPLKPLSDMTSAAHTRIQQACEHINPVVAVRRGMRDVGIPADAVTIDCLRTGRRIMLVLHDQVPGMLLYQFITIAEEAGDEFRQMPLSDVETDTLYSWMEEYFGQVG